MFLACFNHLKHYGAYQGQWITAPLWAEIVNTKIDNLPHQFVTATVNCALTRCQPYKEANIHIISQTNNTCGYRAGFKPTRGSSQFAYCCMPNEIEIPPKCNAGGWMKAWVTNITKLRPESRKQGAPPSTCSG
jgi:hypothetical protein